MPSIHLRGVSYAHTTASPILADVDLDLAPPPTWISVVGANGAGKTTLLDLVAGRLTPTAGRVDVLADAPPLLVPQDVGTLDDAVRAFGVAWDGYAERLRHRLDLDPDDLDASMGRGWAALSPGQRKRWQVATALHARPDVLLLDEPTNHLDGAGRDLLLDALRSHRGLGLVVSHDRALLDGLTGQTVRVHGGTAGLYAGSYSEAFALWATAEQALRIEHRKARREARRERRILAEVRGDRHSAEAAPRRARRLAGANDPDAREAGRKFAQAKAEASLAARVRQLNTRAERADERLAAITVSRDHAGTVAFEHTGTGRRFLAMVRGDVPDGGGRPWLRDVDVTLARGDRVRVDGANGAGKTTLLRALLAALEDLSEPVAVLPQELPDPLAEIEALRRMDPQTRGRVLGIAARLGVAPDRIMATDDPSPGEARKVAIAKLLADPTAIAVLDEPTNHLDLPSIERLEEALAGFPGTLLLVTHDDGLAATTTTSRWRVKDGRVIVDAGGGSR